MNIKSLLLGSAAALLAVSGARAADMVEVAPEAEPMEYVRICDTYGAGFYYIPGTETCLRVGGFVRYQISFGNDWRLSASDEYNDEPLGTGDASNYGWTKAAIASIQLDARTETEYGTLRAFIDARTLNGSTGGSVDKAFLSLGGLTIGRASNAFDYDFGGEQDLLGDGTFNVVKYTFDAGNGFSAEISLDDDGDVISGRDAWKDYVGKRHYGDNTGADFIPNISANVQYTSSAFDAGLYGAWDNDTREVAIKGIVGVNVTEADRLSLAGYWQSGPTYVLDGSDSEWDEATTHRSGSGATTGVYFYRSNVPLSGRWSLQGEYKHTFSDRLSASLGAVYISDIGNAKAWAKDAGYTGPVDKANFWRVGSTIDYVVTPGFNIKTSINYNKFSGSAVRAIDDLVLNDDKLSRGYVNGFVRFQRNF